MVSIDGTGKASAFLAVRMAAGWILITILIISVIVCLMGFQTLLILAGVPYDYDKMQSIYHILIEIPRVLFFLTIIVEFSILIVYSAIWTVERAGNLIWQ